MIVALCEGWRLRPFDHLQWVVERLAEPRCSRLERVGERWLIQGYCRTKVGVETVLSRSGLRACPSALAGVPEYFVAEARRAADQSNRAVEAA
jgi:hypothetical protein